MKKHLLLWVLLTSLFSLFSETSYSANWLVLDDNFKDNWAWTELGGDLEGRLYKSNSVTQVEHRVLILCSKKSSSYILAFNKILEVVEERLPKVEFLFFNYNKDSERAAEIVQFGMDEGVDLILSMGSEAMIYCSENLQGALPVVTCVNKDPVLLGYVNDYKSGSGTNIAYTSVNVPLNVNVEWIFKVRPQLKALTLLYDPDHSSVVASEVEPLKAYLASHGVSLYDAAVPSGDDIAGRLAQSMGESLEYMNKQDPGLENSLFWLTSSTNIFSQMEVISDHATIVPVVSSVPNTVNGSDDSAMLAIGIDRRNSANLSALYMVEILKGTTLPGDLPVGVVTPPDISLSFKTAKRIGEEIPFDIFENASFLYGYDGSVLRTFGKKVQHD